MKSVSTVRRKQDLFSFELPSIFAKQSQSVPNVSAEEFEAAYLKLDMKQREAVFTLSIVNTDSILLDKLASLLSHLFKLTKSGSYKEQVATIELHKSDSNAHAPVFSAFDRLPLQGCPGSRYESFRPNKNMRVIDTFKFIKSNTRDFLRNTKRCRSKGAYRPELWSKIFTATEDHWYHLECIFVQLLEFKFLMEYHFDPSTPFFRIKRDHPGEQCVTTPQAEVVHDEDALIAELEGTIVKPPKKVKKPKKKVIAKPRAESYYEWRDSSLKPPSGVLRSVRNTFLTFQHPQPAMRPRSQTFSF